MSCDQGDNLSLSYNGYKLVMSVLEKIEELLIHLSDEEKAKLMQWLASELSGLYPGIEKTPEVCSGSARIARTRIPVWSLVHSSQLGLSDETLLKEYPTLTRGDLINAWNYYRANKEEIEDEIKNNNLSET